MPDAEPLLPDDPREVGPYRLTGRLGMGGQGVVYLGAVTGGAPVAVKLLREELAADPRVRERFMKEIAAARRVDPFCIAQVLDASLEGPRPYIVTEYIEGPSLQQAGARESAAAVQRLAVATATALAAIHGAGIVHRDFKPSNVLLGSDGPRVIDFGIARDSAAPLTMTSSIIGTPAYMAPEQFAGEVVGPAADVFAWGAVVAYAATGHPPFGADTLPAIMHRVLQGEPRLGDLSEPLRSLVLACLAKDPAQRPTMQDVVLRLLSTRPAPGGVMESPAAVTRVQGGTASPPLPLPMGASGPRQRRQGSPGQNLVVALGVAAAVVLAMAVVTAGVIFWPEQSDASNSAKGNGSGADGGAGQQNGKGAVPNAGNAGGGKGKPSTTPTSPKKGREPGASTNPKPGSGGKPRDQEPDDPDPAPEPPPSGGGGGGGGGDSLGMITLSGGCSGSRYGYQYQIKEPSGRPTAFSYTIYENGSWTHKGNHIKGTRPVTGSASGEFGSKPTVVVTIQVSGAVSARQSVTIRKC
ncbi:serine/threonine-protein kinase [Spirillospora sp. NPDC048911]|uniref:serine/threonine-protein kinase n=1 Tax=Spirillospora sp. NPDC048911 TaxID=3364527 RepID=UPI00371A6A47